VALAAPEIGQRRTFKNLIVSRSACHGKRTKIGRHFRHGKEAAASVVAIRNGTHNIGAGPGFRLVHDVSCTVLVGSGPADSDQALLRFIRNSIAICIRIQRMVPGGFFASVIRRVGIALNGLVPRFTSAHLKRVTIGVGFLGRSN